jgi:hypothetical protein
MDNYEEKGKLMCMFIASNTKLIDAVFHILNQETAPKSVLDSCGWVLTEMAKFKYIPECFYPQVCYCMTTLICRSGKNESLIKTGLHLLANLSNTSNDELIKICSSGGVIQQVI